MIINSDKLAGLSRTYVIEFLLNNNKFKKFAEIGVWGSRFCRVVLRGVGGDILDEYWAIDPWELMIGKYDGTRGEKYWDECKEAKATKEDWFKMYWYCCRLMTFFPQLRVVKMTSEQASTIFPDGYFDMVFIDAVHTFEHVNADIGYWLPKVRKGGIIGGHDYWHKKFPGVTEAVDKWFGKDIEVWVPGPKVWMKRI